MKKIISGVLAAMMLMFCFTGCTNKAKTSDDTVMTINGVNVSWDEYMYFLGTAVNQLNSIYSSGGEKIDWDANFVYYDGITNAEWCIKRANEIAIEACTIQSKAKELGLRVTDEQKKQLDEEVENIKNNYATSDDIDSDYANFLSTYYYTPDTYYHLAEVETLLNNIVNEVYKDKAIEYAEENGYVTSAHILLANFEYITDEEGNTTRESISEDEINSKKIEAENIVKELQAITDDTKRYDRFMELMSEKSEDTGKAEFPKGYCFNSDSGMVEEYETTTRELENYQVKLVESEFGYHIIMRLPTTPDDLVMAGSRPISLVNLAASEYLENDLKNWSEGVEAKLTSSFKNFDFTQFFTDEGFTFVSYADYQADKK